jgi:serine phosphatase RsbU (regulator of sigma subunit)
MEQLPLALIPGGAYTTGMTTYSAGDLFLMVTDGTTEVVNERDKSMG